MALEINFKEINKNLEKKNFITQNNKTINTLDIPDKNSIKNYQYISDEIMKILV